MDQGKTSPWFDLADCFMLDVLLGVQLYGNLQIALRHMAISGLTLQIAVVNKPCPLAIGTIRQLIRLVRARRRLLVDVYES